VKVHRTDTARRTQKFRRMIWSIALVLGLSMALPLTGLLLVDNQGSQAVAQPQTEEAVQQARQDQMRIEQQRREFWRQARGGIEGYSAVTGPETGVLIQSGGDVWRAMREGPIKRWGGIALIGVLAAIILFHLVAGSVKLEERTGRTITRWSVFERAIHWYTAILFIILAITGLSLLFGRSVLIPIMGREAFAAWASFAKPVHDWLAVPFAIGLILMVIPWLGQNIPKAHDFTWLKMGGGYLDKSKHPPADFVNAGEKIWYWLLFFGGIVLIWSGFYLLFPNLGWERSTMQLAHIAHAISGVALVAFSLGHIYLGTLGNQGSFEGMWTGEVDEAWAKAHHNLWYDQIKKEGKRPATGAAPQSGHAAPT
jgi:formate dehydrogenase subunit gamma